MDVPGTIRQSGRTMAFLTTDQDEAPWLVSEPTGERYWATHDEVKHMPAREPSQQIAS